MESVTVCVHYADFLAISLPRNRNFFDRTIVVTTAEDSETRRVCDENRVECVLTARLNDRGARFNKGCALNDAAERLTGENWVAVLDADTVIPTNAVRDLRAASLDPRVLYSARRRMAFDRHVWDEWISSDENLRLPETHHDRRGYARLGPGGAGYFALFHPSAPCLADRRPWFAEHFPGAGGVDIEFARLWGPWRQFLAFDVVHLGRPMQNWHGRRSPAFV